TTVTVSVALPLASGAEAAADARRVIGLERGQPAYRILVADERWESRTLLARLLASAGFDVREARDGDEALAEWSTWHPHLVFVSTRLPGEESLAVAREIRKREGVRGQGAGVRDTVPGAVA